MDVFICKNETEVVGENANTYHRSIMKKSILIIGVILGFISHCNSQNFPFLTKNINTLVSSGIYINGSYFVVGNYADTNFSRVGISSYVSKTKDFKLPFSTSEININSEEWYNIIANPSVKIKASDRGILSTGYSSDTFDRTYSVLHIQDTNGIVALHKRYLMGSGDYAIAPGAALETRNKDLLIVGKRKYNQLYFIRTDDTGAIKYSKNINVLWGTFGWPHSVIELDSGDFMIAVDDFYDPGTWPPIGADLPIKTILIKTDSTGTEKWRWMDSSNSSSASHSFQKTMDGGYVSCGKEITVRDSINNTVGYQGLMIKWDSAFNEVFRFTNQNTMSTNGGGEFFDVVETFNGDFVICGRGGDNFTYHESNSGFMLKLDKEGNIKWRKFYRSQRYDGAFNDHYLYDLDVLPNGDIVAVGEINPQGGSEIGQQGWLLRVDSNGCVVDTNWCGYDNIEIEPTYSVAANHILEIYPNPSSEIINLKMNEFEHLKMRGTKIEIYDAMGRAILKYKIATSQEQPIGFRNDSQGNELSLQINISDFNTGLYFVRILDKNNIEIANGKFVKE